MRATYESGELDPSQATSDEETQLRFVEQERKAVISRLLSKYATSDRVRCEDDEDVNLLHRLRELIRFLELQTISRPDEPLVFDFEVLTEVHCSKFPAFYANLAGELYYRIKKEFSAPAIPIPDSYEDLVDEEEEEDLEDGSTDDLEASGAFYGHNGFTPGDLFKGQASCKRWGLHGEQVEGVKGHLQTGAYSVVVADRYGELNDDQGDTIYYAGTGAAQNLDPDNVKETPQLQTLRRSHRMWVEGVDARPVRVIRAARSNRTQIQRPETYHRYDGLYWVVDRTLDHTRPLKKNDKDKWVKKSPGKSLRDAPDTAKYERFTLVRMAPGEVFKNAKGENDTQGTLRDAKDRGDRNQAQNNVWAVEE